VNNYKEEEEYNVPPYNTVVPVLTRTRIPVWQWQYTSVSLHLITIPSSLGSCMNLTTLCANPMPFIIIIIITNENTMQKEWQSLAKMYWGATR